jgi:hypothetical protein
VTVCQYLSSSYPRLFPVTDVTRTGVRFWLLIFEIQGERVSTGFILLRTCINLVQHMLRYSVQQLHGPVTWNVGMCIQNEGGNSEY